MSAYRKNIVIRLKIDGTDEHAVTVLPMSYDQSMEIYDAAVGLDVTADDARRAMSRKARDLVAGAVVSIDPPILDADGQEVTVAEFVGSAYFSPAMSAVTNEWLSRSTPQNP